MLRTTPPARLPFFLTTLFQSARPEYGWTSASCPPPTVILPEMVGQVVAGCGGQHSSPAFLPWVGGSGGAGCKGEGGVVVRGMGVKVCGARCVGRWQAGSVAGGGMCVGGVQCGWHMCV